MTTTTKGLLDAGFRLRPNQGERYDDAIFVDRSWAIAAEFERLFLDSCSEIVAVKASSITERKWCEYVRFHPADAAVVLRVVDWLRSTGERFGVRVRCSNDGRSIAFGRWVRIAADSEFVDQDPRSWQSINAYATACPVCGWADVDRPPDPLLVRSRVSAQPKREIFNALNGIFVVRQRVHDLLRDLVSTECQWGRVAVDGRRDHEPLYWFRPRQHIGPFWGQTEAEHCAACGRPKRVPREQALIESWLVTDFGPAQPNIALVGPHGFSNSPVSRSQPQFHEVVVSGGLFAALFNHDINGLVWPEDGPYISVRPDQPPVEPIRRFAESFPPSRDKIVKKKAT
jgi:hypothetical protein